LFLHTSPKKLLDNPYVLALCFTSLNLDIVVIHPLARGFVAFFNIILSTSTLRLRQNRLLSNHIFYVGHTGDTAASFSFSVDLEKNKDDRFPHPETRLEQNIDWPTF